MSFYARRSGTTITASSYLRWRDPRRERRTSGISDSEVAGEDQAGDGSGACTPLSPVREMRPSAHSISHDAAHPPVRHERLLLMAFTMPLPHTSLARSSHGLIRSCSAEPPQ